MLPWPRMLVEVSTVMVTVGSKNIGLLEMEGEPARVGCLGGDSLGEEPEASDASMV